MELHEIPEVDQTTSSTVLIEVSANDDGMTGFLKLIKQGVNPEPVTQEQLMAALRENRITYGIKESSVEKLAARPIYNIKIEVAKGLPAVFGQDGSVTYYVKRDSEYRPEINLEGSIDYKNLDYFQLVKKGQVLAEIVRETEGTEGINIYGGVIPTKNGRPAPSPVGKNTHLIQDDMVLVSECDGVVRFLRDSIDVNDVLKVKGNVDQLTGNINFTGDVNVDGDVTNGFSVKSGGNIIVKGVVEDAAIEAAGNVHISNGINGAGTNTIHVGGNLKCKYIEHAKIHIEGNVSADYIIDSSVTCMGNIELAGSRELIVGGEIRVFGELRAKDIGSASGRNTKIEVMGVKNMDSEGVRNLTKTRDALNAQMQQMIEDVQQLARSGTGSDDDLMDQVALAKKKILDIRHKADQVTYQIQQLKKEWTMEFPGCIICKRKIYQGVKISFGEEKFHFELDDIEHCKLFWADGTIIQGTL